MHFAKFWLSALLLLFSTQLWSAVTVNFAVTLDSHRTYKNTYSLDPSDGQADVDFKPKTGRFSLTYSRVAPPSMDPNNSSISSQHEIIVTEISFFEPYYYSSFVDDFPSFLRFQKNSSRSDVDILGRMEYETAEPGIFYTSVQSMRLTHSIFPDGQGSVPSDIKEFFLASINQNAVFDVSMEKFFKQQLLGPPYGISFDGETWNGKAYITSIVPIPAAFWLLISAVLPLIGFRKTKHSVSS